MRMPRFRIRTMMILVAVIGMVAGGAVWTSRHHRRFAKLAMAHRNASWWMEMADHIAPQFAPGPSAAEVNAANAELSWHSDMAWWYDRNSWRPWVALTDTPTAPPGPCRHHPIIPGLHLAGAVQSGEP